MVFEPRFRRVAALNRSFVNRESALEAVAEELGRIGQGPRVLNVTGVGGIGKSRLLREIRDRVSREDHRTADLDLQVPVHRQQADALAVLRLQLGEQGARFDRYDIAYAVLWQRLHPHLRISRTDLPFAAESEALMAVVDAASGVPVFGTAVHLLRLLERARTGHRRRHRVKVDDTLRQLDGLPNAELVDAVTYLFAEDLRAASGERPYTVFIDAYDAMRTTEDEWLCDLIAQLDLGLVVIASREPVRWEGEWAEALRTVPLHGLPMGSRLELLHEGGITDPQEQQTIARASAGVPFYLHLAVDTRVRGQVGVVSGQEILRRFLQHVGAEEIRFLDLLSVARFFDFEIFQSLAEAFQLPAHRMAWESLTSYSFVYPAGPRYLQLHQLMATALRERLSAELTRDVHRVLRRAWDDRDALREAVYHGLAAGDLSSAELLAYADRIKTSGGARGIGGILGDLENHRSGALAEAIRCLETEEAILLGDATRATELTPDETWALDTEAGARLAVVAAHGRRIAGDTAAALTIYTAVWEGGCPGDSRHDAGLWAADLHMAQGRFARAHEIASQVQAVCPAEDAELCGDLARLRHLADRFSYDFESARRHLDEATRCYEIAGSVFGRSAVQTNEAELLAWTDPAAAIDAAARAIVTQQDLGALHELGKAYTALALAQLRQGELREAETALDLADEALDRARYRSGRARAELVRAFVSARRGLPARAAASARWAVDELVAVEVYPTLVLLAAQLLEVMGIDDAMVDRAAAVVRADLERDFSAPTREWVTRLLGLDPVELYRTAADRPDAAAGFYNRNVRVGSLLVRIPIAGADGMDLRIWSEHEVLAALESHLDSAPRLRFSSATPAFQVHEFVEGTLLDDSAPRGVRVPGFVLDDVVTLLRQLADVPHNELPPAPDHWPADGDTAGFARRLSDVTAEVYETFREAYAPVFARLGIPDAPLAPIRWDSLASRPFVLVHSDIHRKNMILADGRTVFLDWELALWGDPVYELAVHLHKMAYFPDERDSVLREWQRVMPRELLRQWEPDLATYLSHERVKSSVVDTVRYSQLITEGRLSGDQEAHLISKLTDKLNAAGAVWGWRTPIERHAVEAAVSRPGGDSAGR
jgi:aminoglycoside phosphotransferase (APT) family kinase protein/tetratricopeptide (TPR) repeat protein